MPLQAANVFDAVFRGEYARAMQSALPAEIANVMRIAGILPATGRTENQNWMTAVPDPVDLSAGGKDEKIPYGLLDVQNTVIPMRDYAHGFRVKNNDMKDDRLSLYTGKPAELVNRSSRGITQTLLDAVRDARSFVSFEGVKTQFQAADSHTVGTGDNLIVGTTADATKETMAVLYIAGDIKPLLWYERENPKMSTNAGSFQADEDGHTKWLSRFRGAAAFGFWWDFVFVDMQGIPTIAEFQTILNNVKAQFRSFQLLDDSFVHEQTQFNSDNLVIVVSPNLENVVTQVLSQSLVVVAGVSTENPLKGLATPIFFNGMDQD